MPNKQYLKGRRFEYKRKAAWEKRGYSVMRTAGSHGAFDLIAVPVRNPVAVVELIQCKVTGTLKKAQRLGEAFLREYATANPHFHVSLEAYVHEEKRVYTWTA
jgi:hypothetical protein